MQPIQASSQHVPRPNLAMIRYCMAQRKARHRHRYNETGRPEPRTAHDTRGPMSLLRCNRLTRRPRPVRGQLQVGQAKAAQEATDTRRNCAAHHKQAPRGWALILCLQVAAVRQLLLCLAVAHVHATCHVHTEDALRRAHTHPDVESRLQGRATEGPRKGHGRQAQAFRRLIATGVSV